MEAKDLRIGNWVNEEVLGTVKVIGIDNDYVWVEYRHMATNREVIAMPCRLKFYAIQPIPLTPEVLEACGFEKWTLDREVSYGLPVEIIGRKCKFISYKDNTILFGPWGVANVEWCASVQYLHQLQNLYYALCGTDLTYTPKQSTYSSGEATKETP